MKRGALGASSRPTRLARTNWIPCAFEVHVVHQPSPTARPHHVDRQHLIATVPLQLDPERAQIVVPGHEQRPFDDAISAMLEILLNDRDAPAQNVAVHRARGGPVLGAPQLAHPLEIVRLHGRHELRERLVHRLRDWRLRPAISTTSGQSGEQDEKDEPSLHEARPMVGTTRR